MNLFFRRARPTPNKLGLLERPSCNGCSSCFTEPIETMPPAIQDKLETVRGALIEARTRYVRGHIEQAKEKAREVKRLVGELSSLGDLRKAVDSMFAAHVPETEIQQFIARV